MATIRAIAHRGFPALFPENTLAGFQAAVERGYQYVELDVHLTKDGVPVVTHDHTVDRTSTLTGKVKDLTLAELKRGDFGKGEPIPTLEEALVLLKGKAEVAIELKQMGEMYPRLEERTLAVIEATAMTDDVYVNSFDHYAVERVRRLHSTIRTGVNLFCISPAVFPFIRQLNAWSVAVHVQSLTAEFVETCRQEGVQPIVWPVDTVEAFQVIKPFPEVLATVNELDLFPSFLENAHT
ncbi:glycerophosphodiester phosphodiesterase [Bacillaceae bacterium SIJ1]|uniref:glycerophosphodiester phosphodiesterase n=1 Tax=Litoribacterium kuwaitense TaxID=1398745 RepID=UPI0013EE0F05|nr:glycerophosphodiester phosphodiesterase family protein [Litoribacterium kuwaitense]NGP46497.1 glycerophosphodiester phosphodiesterase [Litoribacterium kuwaitense]